MDEDYNAYLDNLPEEELRKIYEDMQADYWAQLIEEEAWLS